MNPNDESMKTLASMLNAMTHSERIDIRLSKANKELIERAASIEDISVSAFVVASALFNAKIVVLNPPEPNDALRETADRYKQRRAP